MERAGRVSDLRCALHLRIDAGVDTPVSGHISLQFELNDASSPLVLDFAPSSPRDASVVLDTRAYTATPENGHLVLSEADLRPGTNVIRVAFSGIEEGLHRAPGLAYSLFVPARASRVFPCFDQPDLKARWTISLEVPDGWTAISNGSELSTSRSNGRVVYTFRETLPLPTYLLALVAGRLTVDCREHHGRSYRIAHREQDAALYERNVDTIVDLHARAVAWLEAWTDCRYAFDSFDVVLIPGFQFGGMEHPGAIYYHADLLLLGPNATPRQQLQRAHIIAHEAAHLWFGDLVTMQWFDDVWLKEVLANVMAEKILSDWYPAERHDLRFLVQHYPAAYEVDRTPGTSAIRQPLDNLDEAGSMYGPIIYLKAPIAFRDLERRMGATHFQNALRDCLRTCRFGNINWPDLLDLFQRRSGLALADWSRNWIDTPGRPMLSPVVRRRAATIERVEFPDSGLCYGEVVLEPDAQDWLLERAPALPDAVSRAATYLVFDDAMFAGRLRPTRLLDTILTALVNEREDLIVQLLLDQVTRLFWRFLRPEQRRVAAQPLEATLFRRLREPNAPWQKAVWFTALRSIAISEPTTEWLEGVWLRVRQVDGFPLSSFDETALALDLALRLPTRANAIMAAQQARTTDSDRKRRLGYLAPAASGDATAREAFFSSLANPAKRTREEWVLDAVQLVHHPIRGLASAGLVIPALNMTTDVYRTGDIFFPKRWIDRTLWGYQDAGVAGAVGTFIASLPQDYPSGLRRHLRVAAEPLNRAAWWTSRQDN